MTRPDAMPPLPAAVAQVPMTRPELAAWGEALGRDIVPPRLITISGELGAGKTTLVQAIARGYGVTEAVTSPTFALVHVYHGTRSLVYHLDLYRLRDERDLLQIGWDEMVEAPALVLVEWPERAAAALPERRTEIVLQHPEPSSRPSFPDDGGEERRVLSVR